VVDAGAALAALAAAASSLGLLVFFQAAGSADSHDSTELHA